jgi:hypothetical protein
MGEPKTTKGQVRKSTTGDGRKEFKNLSKKEQEKIHLQNMGLAMPEKKKSKSGKKKK